jgi:hypothetical protein
MYTCSLQITAATSTQGFRFLMVSRNSESLNFMYTFLCPSLFWKSLKNRWWQLQWWKAEIPRYRARGPNTECDQGRYIQDDALPPPIVTWAHPTLTPTGQLNLDFMPSHHLSTQRQQKHGPFLLSPHQWLTIQSPNQKMNEACKMI